MVSRHSRRSRPSARSSSQTSTWSSSCYDDDASSDGGRSEASQMSHFDELPRSPEAEKISPPAACHRSSRSASSHSSYGDDRIECVAQLAASLENNQSQIVEMGEYFIGMKTAEEAAECTTPTAMRLYYQMPVDHSVPSRLPLFLVYQSSDEQHFHFPIVQERGRWRVKYGESNKLSYPSLISLMRHHLNYLFASPYVPGTFDSFEVWKAYMPI